MTRPLAHLVADRDGELWVRERWNWDVWRNIGTIDQVAYLADHKITGPQLLERYGPLVDAFTEEPVTPGNGL